MKARLTDLHPQWMGSGGEGITMPGPNPCPRCRPTGGPADPACPECHGHGREYVPAPRRDGVGVIFDCPCGDHSEGHQCYVPFANPLDGGPSHEQPPARPGWQRTGETFETLTLTPSILRVGGCGWHGFITDGEVISV